MALDPFPLQYAMEPETIEPGLLDDNDRITVSGPHPTSLLKLGKPRKQLGMTACRYRMLRHLLAVPRRQRGISQVERLSSNETKIAPRSVRMALGCTDWSIVCMVTLQDEWSSNLILPIGRSPSTPHGIYDGHTLSGVIDATEKLTGCAIERAYVEGLSRPRYRQSAPRLHLRP